MSHYSAQVNDGYNFDFTIPGRGPWLPITGKYRPASPEAVYEYQDAGTGKKRMAASVKLLLGPGPVPVLSSWDVVDQAGAPVPISEAAIRRIPAPQLDKLLNIVSGYALEEWEQDAKN